MTSQGRAPDRWLMFVVVGAGLLGLLGTAVGAVLLSDRDELGRELVRGGVQVIAVAVIGSLVAAAWKALDDERARRRELHERRLAVFRDVVADYNGVKAIRRTLRSMGLAATDGTMTQAQSDGFREQMLRLNTVQLTFEALTRELGETDLFGRDTPLIVDELAKIEDHLNRVLDLWEHHGVEVQPGTPIQRVSAGLAGLVGPDRLFRAGVVFPRRRITELVHNHLFGPASEETRRELAARDHDEDAAADRLDG